MGYARRFRARQLQDPGPHRPIRVVTGTRDAVFRHYVFTGREHRREDRIPFHEVLISSLPIHASITRPMSMVVFSCVRSDLLHH